MKEWTLTALIALLVLMVAGCGLLSGTVFVTHDIDDRIAAVSTGPLDELQLTGALVDLRDNGDLEDIDVDGIEDLCVVTIARNFALAVEGEVWVIADTVTNFSSLAQIQAAGGFRVFHGLALEAGTPTIPSVRTFTCAETLELFENLQSLADLIADPGVFQVYALAEDGFYSFELTGTHLGMHVTGSL